ncbi:hypothetical protein BDZ45DRAFT_209071 [Acephala macrosclerotiorum]|nr:hypothetical protein BDZ45DRAFT_209071 [Acephala macrosclerotiorum]
MEDVPTPNFSSQAPLPHEANLQPPQQVRKRKSTIGEKDKSSRKNAKISIESGGLLDNLETGEASSKCLQPFFNTEKDDGVESITQQLEMIKLARREKAEKSVKEQRWVKRSRCGSCGLPIAWRGICKRCEEEGEREPEPVCVSCRAPAAPGRKCKACIESICKDWAGQVSRDNPEDFDYTLFLDDEYNMYRDRFFEEKRKEKQRMEAEI